jgi:hypothetical protein
MFQRIWAQHKKFILQAGSGLALFLILDSCVGSSIRRVDGPDGLRAQALRTERSVRAIHKELARYKETKSSLESFRVERAEVRAALELPPERELERLDTSAPLLQFNQAIDRVWAQALEKANRLGISLPEKLAAQDFGAQGQGDKEEYQRHYAYLGLVRRALGTLVDAGMSEIGRPELVEEDTLPIHAGEEWPACVFRAVRFKVAGNFESFLGTLQSVQEPKAFLQVRVRSLQSKSATEDRGLKGELEFVAIAFSEAPPAEREQPGVGPKKVDRKRGSKR